MALVTGPLQSFDASGKVANSIVFAKWKGRNYVRQHVIPSNPKSPLQVGVRSMMAFLSRTWAGLGSTEKGSWEAPANAGIFSPFNAYCRANMDLWGRDLAPFQEYPQDLTTTPVALADLTPTGGVRSCSVSVTVGTNTNSWGIVICRSQSMGFTPSRANAIAVLAAGNGDTVVHLDTPLAPGTYYYRACNFNIDGAIGAYIAEETATVT